MSKIELKNIYKLCVVSINIHVFSFILTEAVFFESRVLFKFDSGCPKDTGVT